MHVTLIYNPDAGGDHQPSGDDLLELIHKAGHSATFQSSKDAELGEGIEESSRCRRRSWRRRHGRSGGQADDRQAVPIAILPMGTANNIATSLA